MSNNTLTVTSQLGQGGRGTIERILHQWRSQEREERNSMLTTEQILEYIERVIAEDRLSGNRAGLRNTQLAAGFLMNAARAAGDNETARKFQLLAAQAANKSEELERR